jgi:ABC-type nitrate/sulfonate/bicarbonate transport system substrate-binding protein
MRKVKQLGFAEATQKIGVVSSAALAAFATLVASSRPALALDKVTFGLNWLADPEAGGYYQAVVDGTYAKYGLDVTIEPGRRPVLLLRMDDQSLGIQLCEREALRLRFSALHRQQTFDPGGLSDLGAYAVEQQGHFKPNVFLLADRGYSTYSSLIEARREMVERNPDLVQRFVNASAIGWYHYLYGDNAEANEAIKRANPGLTDGQIAYSIAKLK